MGPVTSGLACTNSGAGASSHWNCCSASPRNEPLSDHCTALSSRGNTDISAAEGSRAWAHRSLFVWPRQLTEGLPVHSSASASPHLLYLVLLHGTRRGGSCIEEPSTNLLCTPRFRPLSPPISISIFVSLRRTQQTSASSGARIVELHATRTRTRSGGVIGWRRYTGCSKLILCHRLMFHVCVTNGTILFPLWLYIRPPLFRFPGYQHQHERPHLLARPKLSRPHHPGRRSR